MPALRQGFVGRERQSIQHGPNHHAAAIDTRLLTLQLEAAVVVADRPVDPIGNPAAAAAVAVYGACDPLIRRAAFQKQIARLHAGCFGLRAGLEVEEFPQTAFRDHVENGAVEAPVLAAEGLVCGCLPDGLLDRRRLRRASRSCVLRGGGSSRRCGLSAAGGADAGDRRVARAHAALDQQPYLGIAVRAAPCRRN